MLKSQRKKKIKNLKNNVKTMRKSESLIATTSFEVSIVEESSPTEDFIGSETVASTPVQQKLETSSNLENASMLVNLGDSVLPSVSLGQIDLKSDDSSSDNVLNNSERNLKEISLNDTTETLNQSFQIEGVRFEVLSSTEFLVRIALGFKLHFFGTLKAKVVEGCVTVLGWVLNAGEARAVFSPRASSLIGFEAVDKACVLKLTPLDSHLVSCLHTLVPVQLFVERKSRRAESSKAQAERSLNCNFLTKPSRDMKVTKFGFDIQNVIKSVVASAEKQKNHRTVLCGGKGVGKSTLLRVLTNSILSHQSDTDTNCGVLVIDLDPGQSEFMAPGTMSATLVTSPILGPGYTQKRTPDRMLFLGQIDVSRCVKEYRQVASDLIHYCKGKFKSVPWLINTMGFNTGLGASIMEHVLKCLGPNTLAVELKSRDWKRNYPQEIWRPCTKGAFSYCDVYSEAEKTDRGEQQQASWGLPPKQIREIALLAYLSPALQQPDFSLISTSPFKIKLEELVLGVVHEKIHPSHILRALLGNLVGLCYVDRRVRSQCIRPDNSEGPLVLLQPSVLPCFGYGVVTGIDLPAGQLYLQTPEFLSRLSEVNCLLLGAVQIPDKLRTNGVKEGTDVPYTATGSGQATSTPARRYYRPPASFTPKF